MRDLPNEVVVAGETEALPEKLSTIWQSPFIRKFVTENGVSCWQCLHCNNSKRGHNASKVTKHVTGLGNQNVSICRGAISAEWRVLYRDLALTNMEKVAQQKSAAAEFNRVQERHDSRSLQAVQKAKQARSSKSTSSSKSMSSTSLSSPTVCDSKVYHFVGRPCSGIRSDRGLTTWQRKQKPNPIPQGQMTLASGLPNPTGNEDARNKVARYLINTNKPMSDVEDKLFRSMCLSFRNVDSKFEFPNRGTMTNRYLPAHAKSRRDDSYNKLQFNASVFGIVIFGDGATIKRLPLINLLASSGMCPSALLEIVDCTKHMASGGIKSAEYIAGLMTPHVEKLGKDNVDLFLFDGASNVQKAGQLMAIDYPRTSCFHAAEHLMSLYLGDICSFQPVLLLCNFYKKVYGYFGGARHKLYAVFAKHTRAHNKLNGHSLQMFKMCKLRMAIVLYCFVRWCRVKDALLDTLCCTETIECNVPIPMKRLLQDDRLWQAVVALLRFCAPALHLLRITDRREPGMDKTKYFAHKMEDYMIENAGDINDLFGGSVPEDPAYPNSIWRSLDQFLNSREAIDVVPDKGAKAAKAKITPQVDDDSSSDESSVGSVDSEDDGEDVGQPRKEAASLVPKHLEGTFVGECLEAWNKRRSSLLHEYSIAGWLLSPAAPIMAQAFNNYTKEDRRAMETVLLKLLLKPQPTEQATKAAKLHLLVTFWSEFEAFHNRQGEFHPEMLGWDDGRRLTHPHLWHQQWTLPYTEVFGKVSCIVTSKLVGQGQSDRTCGYGKDNKSNKRLNFSSNNLMDQVTCYGAYCEERAQARAKEKESLQLTITDDD